MGGGETISTETPRVSSLRINSSAYGLAIPLVWGTSRIAGNLIYQNDFIATPHVSTESMGGKGGGGGGMSSTTYTYTSAMAIGLCAGVIGGISRVWSNKDKTSIGALGLTVFTGAMPQTPWAYLTSNHPDDALGYSGLAYVATAAMDLGDSGNLPNLSFEVIGPRTIGEIEVGVPMGDAHPDEILSDMLTDPLNGAHFPADRLASLASYRSYCHASAFFLSPALTEQSAAKDHVRDLCRMTNSEVVWSEGLLKVIPYGDTEVTGYGVTWTPDLTPAYDLTDDDFLAESGEDPVRIRRTAPADAYNHVQVEFKNRDLEYNTDLGQAKDAANIAQFGLRTRDPLRMHWISRKSMADAVADLVMRRDLYIRNEYQFRLGWRYSRLEPMDIVTLTHAAPGLTLNRKVVRIKDIDEGEDGDLDITAEEMPWSVATPARVTTQSGNGATVDFNVAAGNANAPVIFEPPISLAGRPELWLATSGGDNWGGAEVWISLDNATYTKVGRVTGPARHGSLAAQLPAAGDPDITSTLSVDLGVSRGQLLGGTLQDRDLLNTLCWVDGELVSYQDATLTGAHQYALTSLRRGAWGTPIGVHAQNSRFVRLDAAVFKYAFDRAMVGETVYVKLRSYNIYGGGVQNLADLAPATYTIAGAPVGGVGGLYAEQPFTGRSAKVAWSAMAGAAGYRVEVWAAAARRRTTDTIDTRYEYGFEEAKADGGPWRTLEFRVYALTDTGISTTAAVLQVTNPQVGAPTAVAALALLEGLTVSCARPGDTDYAGCRVWVSDTTGFDPAVTAPAYDGPDPAVFIYGLAAGAVRYVRIGCYDVFGADGMTLSSEIMLTIRGITADPATQLAEINALLTNGSGTDRIELLADRFAIKAPDSNKYPFAVVDVGAGVYKTLLNSDVLIGGNVDIANLKTGSLPSDVIMRLGGGTVELDGAGEVRVYQALGANQDFVSLTGAQILFKQYVAGLGYVNYNYLSRIEAGSANNNDTVVIPGYWKEQPRVMVSPAGLGLYKQAYGAQDQSIQCQALSLQEVTAGSGRWQFNAVATLSLAANSGSAAINETSGDISANSWTSASYTTPANCNQITPAVSLRSQRGNGSGQYYYRSVRWRVEYWSGSAWVPGAWHTVAMGAQFNAVADSAVFDFPSAAAWQWRIAAEQFDTDGTVFGSQSYSYSQETVTAPDASATQGTPGGSTTFGSTFATPSGSGEIYEIDLSWQYQVQVHYTSWLNGKGLGAGGGATWSNFNSGGVVYPQYSGVSYTSGTQSADVNYTSPVDTRVITGSNLTFDPTVLFGRADMTRYFDGTYYYACTTTVTLKNQSAVIKRRTLIPNSTTPVNFTQLSSYSYNLTSAQVLATGSLNWLAVGR